MLIGLLSDAHGNPLGLRAALRALRDRGVDRTYFLGDAVGYLPGEQEVLRILAEEGVECVRGNHEAMLLGQLPLDPDRDRAYQLSAVGVRLDPGQREFIASWPATRELVLDGRRILLVHGSPEAPLEGYVYPDADLAGFGALGYGAIFMGNTHRPFTATVGTTIVANVGSCGLPRDQGDLPACAIFDTASGICEILRVPVPPEAVLAQFTTLIHPSVVECLHRRAVAPVGTVVRPVGADR
jgi:predicted phosphodiesterase